MAKQSSGPSVKKVRGQLDDAAKTVASMSDTPSAANTKPLDIALSSPEVLDRLAAKIVAAGAQPDVYYIPSSTMLTWVVFHFQPRLPPLTFRVAVDMSNSAVGTTEDPYIPDRVS
jgi:hypothetical protein